MLVKEKKKGNLYCPLQKKKGGGRGRETRFIFQRIRYAGGRKRKSPIYRTWEKKRKTKGSKKEFNRPPEGRRGATASTNLWEIPSGREKEVVTHGGRPRPQEKKGVPIL